MRRHRTASDRESSTSSQFGQSFYQQTTLTTSINNSTPTADQTTAMLAVALKLF